MAVELPPLAEVELPLQSLDGSSEVLAVLRVEEPDSVDQHLPNRAVMCDLWAHVWGAGVFLAEVLRVAELGGVEAFEIGAGTGVCGLVAARSGARVLVTDVSAEAVAISLRNARALGVGELVRGETFNWNSREGPGTFDLIVAADVLYIGSSVPPVLATVARCLAADGVAVIADPGRPTADELADRAAEVGLEATVHEVGHVQFAQAFVMKRLVFITVVRAGATLSPQAAALVDLVARAAEHLREARTVQGTAMNGFAYVVRSAPASEAGRQG